MSKKSKYICPCFKITKNDLKEYVQEGYTDYETLQKKTKIGTKCSKCRKRTELKFNIYLEALRK